MSSPDRPRSAELPDRMTAWPQAWSDILDGLQGNILVPHARCYSAHLFLRFAGGSYRPVNARRWLRYIGRQRVSTARSESKRSTESVFYSVMLTAGGYLRIGIEAPTADLAFLAGMKGRSTLLGDPPPEEWDNPFCGEIDAHLLIAANDPVYLAHAELMECAALRSYGLSVAGIERGGRLSYRGGTIEHFGHVDGISNLSFPKVPAATIASSLLVEQPTGYWGSYFVFRKLEQNVMLWRQEINRLATMTGQTAHQVAAYAIGRFADGTPVVTSSHQSNNPTSDFSYDADPRGVRCPLQAHIRLANPRRAGINDISRMARRGITYGTRPDLADGSDSPSPSSGVGLLFMSYQRSIPAHFEAVQVKANGFSSTDGSGRGQAVLRDPVVGQGSDPVSSYWPARYGGPDAIRFSFAKTVTMRGGEYFFAPDRRWLAECA